MPKLRTEEMLQQITALKPVRPGVVMRAATMRPATGVQAITPVLNTDLSNIQFVDPEASQMLAQVGQPDAGVPREQVRVPICRLPEVTDAALFEDPAEPTRTFYLPRYRLATRSVSGAEQYAAIVEQQAQGWALTLFLAKYPAPELGSTAQTARELGHDVGVLLRYKPLGAGAITRELAFQEISQAGAELRVALSVGSLAERDELIYALSEPASQAQLAVRRAARVALPIPAGGPLLGGGELVAAKFVTAASSIALNQALTRGQADVVSVAARRLPIDSVRRQPIETPPIVPPRPTTPALPTPRIEVRAGEEYEAGSKRWVRYTVSVTNAEVYGDELFAAAPDLPPCGNNKNAARTWVNIHASDGRYLYGFCALGSAASLRQLWFAVEAGQSPPPAVYIVLNDRKANLSVNSNQAP
ncbi:MAG: hypothetical protein HGA19_18275, partial [Oscillochloris sp.]|nr:hypothetical protein [Oscillochloris sp.]